MKKRAPKPSPSIVLAMMVRNERHVIRRAIESVLPVVSHYVIVDTESTDDTVAVATEALNGKTGEIVSRAWVHHGHNRSELIELARGHGDWLLLLDADEVLEVAGPLPDLAADGYELPLLEGTIASTKTALVRAAVPWTYSGELREVLVCEDKHRIEPTGWGRIVHYEDGAESLRDQYERRSEEADVFRTALERDPHDSRAAFYRAEALRLAGDLQGAIAAYEYRVALGGWNEETFWALYQIAKLHERRSRLADTYDAMRLAVVVGMYLRAHAFRPSRPEPLVDLARHFGERGEWDVARMFAERACDLPSVQKGKPMDRCFSDVSVVRWRARHMLALSCSAKGDRARAEEIWTELVSVVPEDVRATIERELAMIQNNHREPLARRSERPARPSTRAPKIADSGKPTALAAS